MSLPRPFGPLQCTGSFTFHGVFKTEGRLRSNALSRGLVIFLVSCDCKSSSGKIGILIHLIKQILFFDVAGDNILH